VGKPRFMSKPKPNKYETYTREQLIAEVEKLSKRKKYGLVWEEEKIIEKFEKEAEGKLPVLIEDKKREVKTDPDKPVNILIEGDNYHALSVLNYTHNKSIDVIYIDPPYNTGNKDFKYNDKFVEAEDTYRHSKWLAFMSKRLKLAKNLLKNTGVIFISIDDNEQANLKLLCDEIFGETNFIAQLIWEQGKKHIGTFVGINHEYMLIYAKNKSVINDNEKNGDKKNKD
jgi:adenine-specific DNA-methyltransferase